MKVAVLKNPYAFAYVVTDVPEQGRQRLLDDLFWPVENSFLKPYGNAPGWETVAANFEARGVESLEQFFQMRPAPWEDALVAFTDKIAGTGIRWYVHGSAAMAVWGIGVAPRDVNIIFPDLCDFDRVREIFLADTIYPVERCDGWLMGGLGGLFIHANIGIAFHNASDEPFDMGPTEFIEWKGRRIAVSPLEWLKRDNRNHGRPARVELIERFMAGG